MLKGHMINRILHSWSFHMKFIKLAEGSCDKFHMKITRVISSMYNVVNILVPLFLIGSSSCLQVRRTTIKSWTTSKFDQFGPWTAELAALERLEKSPYTYNGRNLVNKLAPSYSI